MKTRVVPSAALQQKDLRAATYVYAPKRKAKELVRFWCNQNPLINPRHPALRDLESLIAVELEAALERSTK